MTKDGAKAVQIKEPLDSLSRADRPFAFQSKIEYNSDGLAPIIRRSKERDSKGS
jgi:hypothetical protein